MGQEIQFCFFVIFRENLCQQALSSFPNQESFKTQILISYTPKKLALPLQIN